MLACVCVCARVRACVCFGSFWGEWGCGRGCFCCLFIVVVAFVCVFFPFFFQGAYCSCSQPTPRTLVFSGTADFLQQLCRSLLRYVTVFFCSVVACVVTSSSSSFMVLYVHRNHKDYKRREGHWTVTPYQVRHQQLSAGIGRLKSHAVSALRKICKQLEH